ncbi:hypothetical protein ATY76_13340 [Rhizobium sp. R339]|uniref:hypothetical protein n=1 Tax=Rhizobium sp. R339 TaxID=1764273 RepID=UPI000B535AA8|nr:hypothetical protein [Rhizobium sp. R339]OWV67908.1 hypothetical protein ATY76_13340 [Rhizobium sp. R339]
MAEILHFPIPAPRPALRLVSDLDDQVEIETCTMAHKLVAKAMESMGAADLDLRAVNVILLDRGGDVAELVSEETVVSLCHALIAVIDAKGCRTADRPLRNAAAKAIAEREGVYNDG